MKFTVIPEDTFDDLQLDAGVLLKTFDPSNPVAPADSAIICATTGGVNPTCVPTFSDFGEDVDNCPTNMKELKHLDGWECAIATTALGTSPELIKLALGCADIDSDTGAITPRKGLEQTDFTDIWWVGDKADGGLVAIQLKNALSTGGFSLQTTKNGKGQIALTITGHVSIDAQTTMPMVFYSMAGEDVPDEYKVTQILYGVTSDFTDGYIQTTGSATIQLTAEQGKSFTNVVVTVGGTDVTSTKYNTSTHKVTLSSLTGDVIIMATAS